MLVGSPPAKFNYIWAYGAAGTNVRIPPQTSSDPTAASFQLGWPPDTFIPVGGGGTPPAGKDDNGIYQLITAWLNWAGGGGPIFYDPTWSTANGGYPKWAMLSNASTPGLFWISTADSNTSDPDTGGANWVAFPTFQSAGNATQIWQGTDATFIPTALSIAQSSNPQSLTDAATVAWNMGLGYNANLLLTSAVGSTRVIGAPTGIIAGRSSVLNIEQPASGGPCSVTWNAIFDWGGAGVPTLSTGASVRDAVFLQQDTLKSKLIASFWPGS